MIEYIKSQKEKKMGSDWNDSRNNYNENGDQDYAFNTVGKNGKPKTIGWSIASLTTGLVSVFTSFFGWSGLILGIAAIIFAVISRRSLGYFDGKTILGLILGIHGILIGITVIVLIFTLDEEKKRIIMDYIKEMFMTTEE